MEYIHIYKGDFVFMNRKKDSFDKHAKIIQVRKIHP